MDQSPSAPPAAASTEPLLDLNTLIVRPFVAIDGARYDILSPSEISVIESHRFGVWGRRLETLANSNDLEDEEEQRQLVDRVARAIGRIGEDGGIPEAVFAKLPGSFKLAIVDVFTGLLLRDRLGVAGAIARAAGIRTDLPNQSTGANSFPGSSGSTADRQPGGWLKRLWPW